ncbi:MAG: NYN domain-containing protein [Candidatus Woesearchaeota archaeon]|nr:NYN domain-containing protein [Candidatus Woesearchaeota archaeon]
MEIKKQRVIAYYDGSNFYHLANDNFGLKGFNFLTLTKDLLQINEELKLIKYFTAPVNQQEKPGDAVKQQKFLAYLEKEPLIKVYYGNLVTRNLESIKVHCNYCKKDVITEDVNCPICARLIDLAYAKKTREKGVDVKLAITLMLDAIEDKYDTALLISSDADFVPAVEYIIQQKKKKVVYCHFPEPFTSDLVHTCSDTHLLTKDLLLKHHV